MPPHVDEQAHASNHVFDGGVGEILHELQEPTFDWTKGGAFHRDWPLLEQSPGRDADGVGQPRDQIATGLETPALYARHCLWGHADPLGDLTLRQSSFVPKGSQSSPDAQGLLLCSGHAQASRRGRPAGRIWGITSCHLI